MPRNDTATAVTTGRLLPLADVRRRTGLSTPTIYRWMKAPRFPQSIALSAACVRWDEDELDRWIASKRSPGNGGQPDGAV